jgi:hypothetical protein
VWQVDELVRVRLEQEPRVPWRLAVRQAVVLDLAQFLLLTPALPVGAFIGWRQHTGANLAGKSRRVDERVHVGIAGGHPQAIPARHGRERVCGTAPGLLDQVLVVVVGGREDARRRHNREGWPETAAEGSGLRDEDRWRADEREDGYGNPAETPVGIHGDSSQREYSAARGDPEPGPGVQCVIAYTR